MGMEDETRDFLVLIMHTAAVVIIWMMSNVFLGIYLGLGLFEDSPSLKNLAYYFVLVLSMAFVFLHLRKKWKNIKLS